MILKGDEVFELLKATVPEDLAQFPPNVAKLLDVEFISYDDQAQIMHVRMPIKPEFNNPLHITFGGTVADGYCYVKAYVVSRSIQFLNLRGEAHKEDGTLVATATSRMMIIDPSRMKR